MINHIFSPAALLITSAVNLGILKKGLCPALHRSSSNSAPGIFIIASCNSTGRHLSFSQIRYVDGMSRQAVYVTFDKKAPYDWLLSPSTITFTVSGSTSLYKSSAAISGLFM